MGFRKNYEKRSVFFTIQIDLLYHSPMVSPISSGESSVSKCFPSTVTSSTFLHALEHGVHRRQRQGERHGVRALQSYLLIHVEEHHAHCETLGCRTINTSFCTQKSFRSYFIKTSPGNVAKNMQRLPNPGSELPT